MEIQIINKISETYKKHKKETGATKTWVALQLGVSPQRFNDILKAENLTLEILIKLSIIFNCDITDLFEYTVIDEKDSVKLKVKF